MKNDTQNKTRIIDYDSPECVMVSVASSDVITSSNWELPEMPFPANQNQEISHG